MTEEGYIPIFKYFIGRAVNNIIQFGDRRRWKAHQYYLYAGGATLTGVVLRKAITSFK